MFVCGALLWAYRDRVTMDRRLAAAAALALAAGSLTPNYRLVAAPAVAYLMLYLAMAWGRHRRLVLSNDLSYGTYVYAYPVQQAALLAGATTAWLPFTVVPSSSPSPWPQPPGPRRASLPESRASACEHEPAATTVENQ